MNTPPFLYEKGVSDVDTTGGWLYNYSEYTYKTLIIEEIYENKKTNPAKIVYFHIVP